VFEQTSLALWSELAEPGAREENDFEAEPCWENLCLMNPPVLEQVFLFYGKSDMTYKVKIDLEKDTEKFATLSSTDGKRLSVH